MNILTKIFKRSTLVAIALAATTLLVSTGTAQARTQWVNGGVSTSQTPKFNDFYDAPNGVGDEADFVRVKPKAGTNADYVNTLNAACNTGDSFNVRTYVHNGASPDFNNNGSGPAVARDVMVQLKAELGSSKDRFKFESSISASNAAGMSDTGFLNCNGKVVKLSLVANSVQTYSKPIGFGTAPDSVVNGSPFKIGSRAQGSGDVWGCWDDRVIVTYELKVQEADKPQPKPTSAVCTISDDGFKVSDRKVSIKIAPKLENATVLAYEINWGDGSAVSTKQADEHTYTKDGTFKIQARVKVRLNDGKEVWVNGEQCAREVTFEGEEPPKVTPPTVTPPTTTVAPPSGIMPATGAGVFAIFSGTSILAAAAHRLWSLRRTIIRW